MNVMYCHDFGSLFLGISGFSRIALLMLAVAVPSPLIAASPAELAQEAESLARQGNMPEAMQRMQQAADALWDLQQLQIVETVLLSDDETQQTPTLRSGEDLSISALVVGFGYRRSEDSLSVSFAVDVDIRHASGRVLASMQDFASVTQTVPNRIAEFAIEINLTTPALLDGDYEAAFTLHDAASGQSGQFSQEFRIEGILEPNPDPRIR